MMNDQPPQQPIPQPQLQPQPQPRKKRTATRLIDTTEHLEIEFNSFGQHCGPNQIKFAKECGVITRMTISIKHENWKKVPQTEKDRLWLTIKNRWNIPDDEHKASVLISCSHKWRSFKKRLKNNFLASERDPLATYSYLNPDTLQEFQQRVSSKEFQLKSEKARASSKLNENPARLGPHGYRGNTTKWEQEMASGELTPQLYEIKSERSRHYVMGRRSKSESGSKVIPPNIEPIVKKLVDVQNEISKGNLVPGPGEDLLTMVIGPEHPGRTRAVGHDVGLRKGLQGIDLKRRKTHDKESIKEIKATLGQALAQIAELQAQVIGQHPINQVPDDATTLGVKKNSHGSTTTVDPVDAIKNPTRCELVLPYGDMKQKCATGMVFPYNDGLIHRLPLRENHLKVMIDDIDKRFENIPVPVMSNEVSNLQEAVGTVIQWPRFAIVLTKVQAAQQQIPTTSALLTTTKVMKKNMPNQKINMLKPIESFRDLLKKNKVLPVVANHGILESGKCDFSVTYEEYFRVLKKQTIDLSIITTWQILLHSMVRTRMNKCAFLNPYKICGNACQKTPLDVVDYLVDAMRLHHGMSFLIAPYLQNNHWVLMVICPSSRVVYILDSLTKPVQNIVNTYYLHKHVEMAFARCEKNTSTPILWMNVECNQQVAVPHIELSGHYVMQWMFDFVTVKQFGFPITSGTPWNDKTPFEEKILIKVVGEWSKQFLTLLYG